MASPIHDRKRIADQRVRAGLTRAGLARRAGLSKQHVSGIESGRTNPSPPTLLRLAAAMRCDITDLMPLPLGTREQPAEGAA